MSQAISTVLIETQYLPPVAYFVLWAQCEALVLEKHENYQKRSNRNRCYLLGASGTFHLSIPLCKGKNERQQISKVALAYDEPWPQRHCRAIQSAYGKAPFFRFYGPEIQSLLNDPGNFLFDFNLSILKVLGKMLGITSPLLCSSEYSFQPSTPISDFRNIIGLDRRWKNYVRIHPYNQVFEDRQPFIENLSILDLLFCKGPEAKGVLMSSEILV